MSNQAVAGTPRLKGQYKSSVVNSLTEEFKFENPMMVPRLEKITINMGLGEAVGNPNVVKGAVEELTKIAGQRVVATRAKKSIAGFKLRQGMPIGCMVTLRGDRMWEFLDRLVTFALPRVRDLGAQLVEADGSVGLAVLPLPPLLLAGEEPIIGEDEGGVSLRQRGQAGVARLGRPERLTVHRGLAVQLDL